MTLIFYITVLNINEWVIIGPYTLATWYKEPTHWKIPWYWERLKAGGEGDEVNEMVGQHHQLNGHEFEQTPGDGEGQRGLACCSPWGHKESDMTEQLNNNSGKCVPDINSSSLAIRAQSNSNNCPFSYLLLEIQIVFKFWCCKYFCNKNLCTMTFVWLLLYSFWYPLYT